MSHQWRVEWQGHKIRVQSTWAAGTRLYLDEQLVDRNGAVFGLPALQRVVGHLDDQPVSAEVQYQMFWPTVKIRVGEELIFEKRARAF
ncbi:hypothetical protein SAMN04488540_10629 [Ferrimonas sediminum]|uniref:Uncharacterized protein n=1 Tax=Ferrimonas sediminum TaxID=718193 RepID=A0A1G8RZJ0_9GAMM|nr:hypothetical protein [Ferrimonas sediminum]SDJ22373.1 hypothetical protein SAMN04488540_10629 [Ferrimonas sediminum]